MESESYNSKVIIWYVVTFSLFFAPLIIHKIKNYTSISTSTSTSTSISTSTSPSPYIWTKMMVYRIVGFIILCLFSFNENDDKLVNIVAVTIIATLLVDGFACLVLKEASDARKITLSIAWSIVIFMFLWSIYVPLNYDEPLILGTLLWLFITFFLFNMKISESLDPFSTIVLLNLSRLLALVFVYATTQYSVMLSYFFLIRYLVIGDILYWAFHKAMKCPKKKFYERYILFSTFLVIFLTTFYRLKI